MRRKMALAPKVTTNNQRKGLQFARYHAAQVTDWTAIFSFLDSELITTSDYLELREKVVLTPFFY